MNVKEKRHRLSKEFYKGEAAVAFTLCLKGVVSTGFNQQEPKRVAADFSLREHEIVNIFTEILTFVVANTGCIVPVYCFMPDHQHLIIMGTKTDSDIWKAIVGYKQKTGFWFF